MNVVAARLLGRVRAYIVLAVLAALAVGSSILFTTLNWLTGGPIGAAVAVVVLWAVLNAVVWGVRLAAAKGTPVRMTKMLIWSGVAATLLGLLGWGLATFIETGIFVDMTANLWGACEPAAAVLYRTAIRQPQASSEVLKVMRERHFSAASAVPVLRIALADDSNFTPYSNVPADALAALAGYGPDAAPALPEVIDVLNRTHLSATAVHYHYGPESLEEEADAKTIQKWHDAAENTIRAIGPAGKSAAPALAERLKNVDKGAFNDNQAATAGLLLTLDPGQTAVAVPVLIRALEDGSEASRGKAVEALSAVTPEAARPALPALQKRMEKDQKAGQTGPALDTAVLLWKLQPDAAVVLPVVKSAAVYHDSTSNDKYDGNLIKLLRLMGHAAFPALDDLRSLRGVVEFHWTTAQLKDLDNAIAEVEKL